MQLATSSSRNKGNLLSATSSGPALGNKPHQSYAGPWYDNGDGTGHGKGIGHATQCQIMCTAMQCSIMQLTVVIGSVKVV